MVDGWGRNARGYAVGFERLCKNPTHDEPWFENHVATLQLDGRRAKITFEGAVVDSSREPSLERICKRRLT